MSRSARAVGTRRPAGGAVEPGELLEATAAREVRGETRVEVRPLGTVGLVSTPFGGNARTSLPWPIEPVSGDPTTDGAEIDHRCLLSFDDPVRRNGVAGLVGYLAARLRDGTVSPRRHAVSFVSPFPGIPSKVFV